MKAIILAAGKNTRLYPASLALPKALLPVYDKPLIYYPLSTLISAGIKDIMIITTEKDKKLFERLLKDGEQLGINITYGVEKTPKGTANGLVIAKDFIKDDNVCMILGDNIFFGGEMRDLVKKSAKLKSGCELYTLPVKNPEAFGVAYEENGKVVRLEEKPKNPTSNLAVTGLYFYDSNAVKFAQQLTPSSRGEYEITSVNNIYVKAGACKINKLSNKVKWLDTGTHSSLLEASEMVKETQASGTYVGCIEEEAYKAGYISRNQLKEVAKQCEKTDYGKHLLDLYESAVAEDGYTK